MALGSGSGVSGLTRMWEQARPPWGLRVLAQLYAGGWHLYESLYRLRIRRRVAMPVPVIGVGSLWVGGVGKTPVTLAIARYWHQQGKRVVVLGHGYGGRRYRQVTLIEPGAPASPLEVGDEACEVRMALPNVPIAVGKWRVVVARQAIEYWKPDLIVLDDGFQHLPLARTVDLVILPSEKPFGNGYCLPTGPLREPPSGLRRAHALLWLGEDEPKMAVSIPAFRVHIRFSEPLPLWGTEPDTPLLPQERVQVVTAIARPERFVAMLQREGWSIDSVAVYPDHHDFRDVDLSHRAGKTVVMTAKDAVKLRERLPRTCRAYVMPIVAQPEDAFWSWLDETLISRWNTPIAR